jgi:hypothetical protein
VTTELIETVFGCGEGPFQLGFGYFGGPIQIGLVVGVLSRLGFGLLGFGLLGFGPIKKVN